MTTYKTISYDQKEILEAIKNLHCDGVFDCDVTYGNGKFYTDTDAPIYKFDLDPQIEGVTSACSTNIPISNNSVRSVVFDPPFLTYIKKGREHNSIMGKRFSGYWRYEELEEHYKKTAQEALEQGKQIKELWMLNPKQIAKEETNE
jgi:hypothetical protein